MKELMLIQTQLKANKEKKNSFGKYNYRSLEDILEAVKPLLKEHGCSLVTTNDLVMVGERYYMKSTATLTNSKGEQVSSTAFAREAAKQGGMADAQVSGSTISYSAKFACNGLLALDDNKDDDTRDNREKKPEQKKPVVRQSHALATDKQVTMLEKLLKQHGVYDERFDLSRLDVKTASEKIDEYMNKPVPTNRVK